MKRILAVLAFLAAALPAQAHFIWLLPPKDQSGNQVQMVFSDTLAPDANVPIAKIEKTKLFGRTSKGETVPVKMKEGKDFYEIIAETKGDPLFMVAGTCQYGVISKGKGDPFLLVYHPKTLLLQNFARETKKWLSETNSQLPLEIVPVEADKPTCRVYWNGKPAAGVEVTLIVPGVEKKIELKTGDDGNVVVMGDRDQKSPGYVGVLAKMVEPKMGKLDDKEYKEIRHYATLTIHTAVAKREFPKRKLGAKDEESISFHGDGAKADPAATKIFAEARAARAAWNNFPGFTADLVVNQNGKAFKGKVEATDKGKVSITLDDKEMQTLAKNEIGSLVSHRMPGSTKDNPCSFADDVTDHPMGRAITIVGDGMGSSFRIKDRQMVEVNRGMKDSRFTITVLENQWNADKKYLPISYVVNTWDAKSNAIKSSMSFHHTWTRMGDYDLPATLLTVTATPKGLESNLFTFSNIRLSGGAAATR